MRFKTRQGKGNIRFPCEVLQTSLDFLSSPCMLPAYKQNCLLGVLSTLELCRTVTVEYIFVVKKICSYKNPI